MVTRLKMTVDWLRCQAYALRHEQRGGGEIIAVVIVIVVVVALGIAFSSNITNMFNQLWSNATSGNGTITTSTGSNADDKLS